ncbi:hypothetical protein VTK26DRAFT_6877 [Humicola hyalothermophila]
MADVAEEPTLPRLPPSLAPGDRRKRMREMEPPPTHSSSTSSDPAIFSSDDDPALDNYQTHGRRKRRYVGTWFDQQPASSDSAVGDETRPSFAYPPPRRNHGPAQPQKREFKRQLDSGVWMGTDGTLTDTDEGFDLEPAAARLPLGMRGGHPGPKPLPFSSQSSEEEQRVLQIVQSCVDRGNEDVDLSSLRLQHVSEGLLESVADIVPIPLVTKDVAFEQRDPKIKVFLSNNLLRAFPVDLLNVEHLTVLSLRANRIVKIPPGIAKLKNLETLNLAQNLIRYLPAEMLELFQKGTKLRNFHFQPNAFWVPRDDVLVDTYSRTEYEIRTFGPRPEVTLDPNWSGLTARLESRTPVHFLDSTLKAHSDFVLPTHDPAAQGHLALELEPFTELATPRQLACELRNNADTSKVVNPRGAKSLLELALAKCAASGEAGWIVSELRQGSDGHFPDYLAPAIERAAEIRRGKGQRCSVCGRDTVMPLAQWIEFRSIGRMQLVEDAQRIQGSWARLGRDGDKPLPFLRVGCSWTCVPVKVEGVRERARRDSSD